jgi:hypothetical protein
MIRRRHLAPPGKTPARRNSSTAAYTTMVATSATARDIFTRQIVLIDQKPLKDRHVRHSQAA